MGYTELCIDMWVRLKMGSTRKNMNLIENTHYEKPWGLSAPHFKRNPNG